MVGSTLDRIRFTRTEPTTLLTVVNWSKHSFFFFSLVLHIFQNQNKRFRFLLQLYISIVSIMADNFPVTIYHKFSLLFYDWQSRLIVSGENHNRTSWYCLKLNLIFVVPCIMLYIGEISPTRCNNCVFYSQWLYATGFGWQSHPSSGVQCCIWPQVSWLT